MSTPTREEFINTNITSAAPSPEGAQCSICYEEYGSTTAHVVVTFSDPSSCNHIFGLECILTWFDVDGVNSCPYCRCELFITQVKNTRPDSDYGSGEETEFDSDSEDWGSNMEDDGDDEEEGDDEDEEEEEGEEEDAFIPLSSLYQNEPIQPTTETPLKVLIMILETTWYKSWFLLLPYISKLEAAIRDNSDNNSLDMPYFNSFLPTVSTLLSSLINTANVQLGRDISGLLDERKLQVLEALLGDMVNFQRLFVSIYWVMTERR
ncbi:hypothetical protein G6011_00907 [Alternaria panax]|uniref:RING-type domain-containing protein n=1 Tax=Alternaria panax TaxID=48097 RepID=A0AAD4NU29_9PLEO|nr:hypothetical protein G6011_00907 [Alternaria panax]